MIPPRPLGLFEGFGVELEYMTVDEDRLDVRPVVDEVLRAVSGTYTAEVERGDISWSNELVLHVMEFKVTDPAPTLHGLAAKFQRDIAEANALLRPFGARLMPSAMHPWMDPRREARLWPHEYAEIYAAFDRIFDCRRHGWANLQSSHINLPFGDDQEFGQLHAAIRLVLPMLPALAASSPLVEGKIAPALDNRLAVYRTNCARIPSITGRVVPEPVFSPQEYQRRILQPMYRDVAGLDPDGTLQYEWLNARGAIARFERNTIEIRLLDMQECPQADLAIAAAVIDVIRALVRERWAPLEAQQAMPNDVLEEILLATIEKADEAPINNISYLEMFGWTGTTPCTANGLWQHLLDDLLADGSPTARTEGDAPSAPKTSETSPAPRRRDRDPAETLGPLATILEEGPLARRILSAVGPAPSRSQITAVYRRLCECLESGTMFHARS